MAYVANLKWMKKLGDFAKNQQKILMVLSHERFKWRTMKNIEKASGIPKDETESIISELIDSGLVRPSFSRSKKVIMGLRERVG